MPSAKDYITPALSASLCELLQLLKERLLQLRSQLCPSVFNTLWKGIAHDLNKFIYEEVNAHYAHNIIIITQHL